jgi:hypothetical protein
MKHAEVIKDGFKVPLIGIDPDAVHGECWLCHDEFGISDLHLSGTQFLCPKCRLDVRMNILAVPVSVTGIDGR